MRQIKFHSKNKIFSVINFVTIIGFSLLTSCEGKDLNRTRAQSLIVASPPFRQAATLSLIVQNETESFGLDKANAEETVEQAGERNLARFLAYHPRIHVANHLGLVSVEQQFVKETKAGGWQIPAQWVFLVKVKANEKGKALWNGFDQSPPSVETELPLAAKEFVSVKGITVLADDQRMAEFAWRWKPNPLALAFQENTDEFKALPADIQKGLLGDTEWNRQLQTDEWTGERQGRALFQRFDDGWRFVRFW